MENKETIVRETRYEYDENDNVTSVIVHETIANPSEADADDGKVVELEGTVEMSPLEILLTVVAGAFLGNLLYRIASKNS